MRAETSRLVQEIFRLVDTDYSGAIERVEFEAVVPTLGISWHASQNALGLHVSESMLTIWECCD